MAKFLSIFVLLLNLPLASDAQSPPRLNLMFNQHGYLGPAHAEGPSPEADFLFFVGEKVAFDAKFVNWTANDLVVRFEDLSASEALAVKLLRRDGPVVEEVPVRLESNGKLSLESGSRRTDVRTRKSVIVPGAGWVLTIPLAIDTTERLPPAVYELRLATFRLRCDKPCELVNHSGVFRFSLRGTDTLPEQLDYFGRRAHYYIEYEKSKEAVRWINRMLDIYPTSSFAYQLRGRYAERRGKWGEAANAYEIAARLLESGEDQLRRQPPPNEGSTLRWFLRSEAERARQKLSRR